MKLNITPNNNRRDLGLNDFIVSKTDTSGRITYANRIFMDIAGFVESDLLGVQHNIIRDPDMPMGVFRFMWDSFNELIGFANITPDYDKDGKLQGYYSVKRHPPQSALDVLIPVYKEILAIEKTSSVKEAPDKSIAYLVDIVAQTGAKSYDRLVLSLFQPNGV